MLQTSFYFISNDRFEMILISRKLIKVSNDSKDCEAAQDVQDITIFSSKTQTYNH